MKRVAKYLAKEKEAMKKIVTTALSVVAAEALDMKFHETLNPEHQATGTCALWGGGVMVGV